MEVISLEQFDIHTQDSFKVFLFFYLCSDYLYSYFTAGSNDAIEEIYVCKGLICLR